MNIMKVARAMLGISQIEMAKKLETAPRTIVQWETRKMIPSLENAVKICNVYNISMEELAKHFKLK